MVSALFSLFALELPFSELFLLLVDRLDVDPWEIPYDPIPDYQLTFKANPKDTVVSETFFVALRA